MLIVSLILPLEDWRSSKGLNLCFAPSTSLGSPKNLVSTAAVRGKEDHVIVVFISLCRAGPSCKLAALYLEGLFLFSCSITACFSERA